MVGLNSAVGLEPIVEFLKVEGARFPQGNCADVGFNVVSDEALVLP